MRSSPLVLCFVALVAALTPIDAHAQGCHTDALRESTGTHVRLSLTGQAATYRTKQFEGEYQGLGALAALSLRWVYAAAALPAYRIVRNGLERRGLGDLALDVRVPVVRTNDDSLRFGLELATTLPTGDEDEGLGMGHVMLMPGPYLAGNQGKLTWLAQLAYGRAISGHHASAHSHTSPLVNPMNRSEIEHAFTLAYAFHPSVRALGRVLGAVPVDDVRGSSREVAGLGLQALAGVVDASIEVHVPVVGTPFSAKTVLSVAAEW